MTKFCEKNFTSNKYVKQLKDDTVRLADDCGRLPGTDGHRAARKYICGRMAEIGLNPYSGDSFEMPYEMGGEYFCNIVGVVPGSRKSAQPVLVGAHYDSVIEAQCADDNAAAVAIALNVAEDLLSFDVDRDIIIAIFDAEEPPYFHSSSMGSTRFYEDQLDSRGVHAALIMDLVGHDVVIPSEFIPYFNSALSVIPGVEPRIDFALPMVKELLFMTGTESNYGMLEVCKQADCPNGLRVINTLNAYVGDMSDHYIFRKNNIPYLFLSCGHWPHYHQETDTVDRLNYNKMARIKDYVRKLLLALSQTAFSRKTVTSDFTLELELENFKKAFGLLYWPVIRCLGFSQIETRTELTEFVDSLRHATGL